MTDACNIEWEQTLKPMKEILDTWNTTLWTQKEFTRVWWMPYMKRAVVWSAEKTSKPERVAVSSWYGGSVGFHTYHFLLWLSNRIPRILPAIEWFVFGMQYGFSDYMVTSAIQEQRTGLLMDCLLPMYRGDSTVFYTKYSASQMLEGIQKYRPSTLTMVPPIIIDLINKKDLVACHDRSSVKQVTCAAAPLQRETVELFEKLFPNILILQSYGETCIDDRTYAI